MDINKINKKLKAFDWRVLKKYTSPKAADDLNKFLEKLPHNSGQTMLILTAIVWGVAGATGLYTTVQIQALTTLRAELQEAGALQPSVPRIEEVSVNPRDVENFINKIKDTYAGLDIKSSGTSVLITANSTSMYGQFRQAIGHVQNGGSGWRVNIEHLCVGRECDKNQLSASLRINKVSVSSAG